MFLLGSVDHKVLRRHALAIRRSPGSGHAIVLHWIDCFGLPLRFRCNDPFVSQLFRMTLYCVQIGVNFTLLANPTAVGLAENANLTYLADDSCKAAASYSRLG